jgi:hypothetical protein
MISTQVDRARIHHARRHRRHLAAHQIKQVVHEIGLVHGEIEHGVGAVARRVRVIARHEQVVEPSAHEHAQRGVLEGVRVGIPEGAEFGGAHVHSVDLGEGVHGGVHEAGNAVGLGEAVELDALLEGGEFALVAVGGED